MDYRNKDKIFDYRVNLYNSGKIISIEVTCCARHIGEICFEDDEKIKCPFCGTLHALKLQYNHFHIRRSLPETIKTKTVQTEEKAF
jgi:hypothetical protein